MPHISSCCHSAAWLPACLLNAGLAPPPCTPRFAVILSGIFAFLMFGIDEIGVQIEEPFGCAGMRRFLSSDRSWAVRLLHGDGSHWRAAVSQLPPQLYAAAGLRRPAAPVALLLPWACCPCLASTHSCTPPPLFPHLPHSILPLEAAGATIERNIRELLARNYEVGAGWGGCSVELRQYPGCS